MLNHDLYTMKRLFDLFEKAGGESFFKSASNGDITVILSNLLKHKQVFKEIIFLITGHENQPITEMIKSLKTFTFEHNKIYSDAMAISEAMGKSKKSNNLPIINSNYYLDIIYNLGKIGNYDCSKINFADAMYFIMRNNEEVKAMDKNGG